MFRTLFTMAPIPHHGPALMSPFHALGVGSPLYVPLKPNSLLIFFIQASQFSFSLVSINVNLTPSARDMMHHTKSVSITLFNIKQRAQV